MKIIEKILGGFCVCSLSDELGKVSSFFFGLTLNSVVRKKCVCVDLEEWSILANGTAALLGTKVCAVEDPETHKKKNERSDRETVGMDREKRGARAGRNTKCGWKCRKWEAERLYMVVQPNPSRQSV